jgi:hypothetical protein
VIVAVVGISIANGRKFGILKRFFAVYFSNVAIVWCISMIGVTSHPSWGPAPFSNVIFDSYELFPL